LARAVVSHGFMEIVSDDFPVLPPVSRHADGEYGLRESANAVVSAAAINICCEQSTYGDGIGVAAARGHLDVPVIVEPSVVSDVGPGLSSGVGLGVASDFGIAPWLAPL
jgi:fructoselysine-6-P-deglycase FrlB-like protein